MPEILQPEQGRNIADRVTLETQLFEGRQSRQRSDIRHPIAIEVQLFQAPQVRHRCQIDDLVAVKLQRFQAGGQLKAGQVANAGAAGRQLRQRSHVLARDGCSGGLAQGGFHGGAQCRVPKRRQVLNVVVGVVADAVEVGIGPFAGVERERVFGIRRTVVVVVRVGVVADAVAVDIEPVVRVLGGDIGSIDNAVPIRIGRRLPVRGDLEAHPVKARNGVSTVQFMARHATGIAAAIRCGIGEHTAKDFRAVGHDRSVPRGLPAGRHVVAARPPPRPIGFALSRGVHQAHHVPEFMRGCQGAAVAHPGLFVFPSTASKGAEAGTAGAIAGAVQPEVHGRVRAMRFHQRPPVFFGGPFATQRQLAHANGTQANVGAAVLEQRVGDGQGVQQPCIGVAALRRPKPIGVQGQHVDDGWAGCGIRVVRRRFRQPFVDIAHAVAVGVRE